MSRAPYMAAEDKVPLIAGSDVAAAADAVLKDFHSYAGQARPLSLVQRFDCRKLSLCACA